MMEPYLNNVKDFLLDSFVCRDEYFVKTLNLVGAHRRCKIEGDAQFRVNFLLKMEAVNTTQFSERFVNPEESSLKRNLRFELLASQVNADKLVCSNNGR